VSTPSGSRGSYIFKVGTGALESGVSASVKHTAMWYSTPMPRSIMASSSLDAPAHVDAAEKSPTSIPDANNKQHAHSHQSVPPASAAPFPTPGLTRTGAKNANKASVWHAVFDSQHSLLRYVHALDAREAWSRLREAHIRDGGVQFVSGTTALHNAQLPELERQHVETAYDSVWDDATDHSAVRVEIKAEGEEPDAHIGDTHLQARIGAVNVPIHPLVERCTERSPAMMRQDREQWLAAWCSGVASFGAVGAVHTDPPMCGVLCFHNHRAYSNSWSAATRESILGANCGTLAANGARLVQLPVHQWSITGTLLHDYASKTGYTGAYTQHVSDMLCSAATAYIVPYVRFGVNTLQSSVQWVSNQACPADGLVHTMLSSSSNGARPPIVSFATHRDRCLDWLFPSPLAWELATQRRIASKLPASTWVDPVTYVQSADRTPWSTRRSLAWARLRMNSVCDPAAHQHVRLHASAKERPECLHVSWESAARRLHAVWCADTQQWTSRLAPHAPCADSFARATPRDIQRHALLHKYRLSMREEGGDSHFAAAVLSGSVVCVVDAPAYCTAPHVWGDSDFDGPYLRRSSPLSDVHASHSIVRVYADLRNLVETIEWLQDHDDVAQTLAQRCSARAAHVFTESNIAWYCASVLQCIAT